LNISRTTVHHASLELKVLPVVKTDESLMHQVVENLLANAIKYSSKKEKPVVTVWSEQTAGKITFYFKDNGAGFDMKNYDRLFGTFQRLHNRSDFEGTGVGLSLVKRIIEKHGGTVGAEAKVGEGAMFYFTLPVL
jgi:light-regulated signal transduction histidine kinase (bacteriophytochrome)